MDVHDKIHYSVGAIALAASIGGAGGLAWHSSNVVRPPPAETWGFKNPSAEADFVTKLSGLKIKSIRIACVADCGDMPERLGRDLETVKIEVRTETIFGMPVGLLVSPDDQQSRDLSALLNEAIDPGLAQVQNIDDSGPLIIFGRKPQKKAD